MSFIEIRDLSKTYPVSRQKTPLVALSGIELSIEEGEFVVFLGPSGCGKSTLLRIVAGLEDATSGEAVFDGTPIRGPSKERGMVFQTYTSFPWLTVNENVGFGLKQHGMPKEPRSLIVRRYVDMVGLNGFENAYPRELSGGMKQRLAIARSLAVEPRVLLMDEPFGALDTQVRQSLQEELLAIQRETQKTILFVTHDIDEALLLGSRIVVFSALPGRVIHDEKCSRTHRQCRDYFFTDEFAAEKRKYARLLETRLLKVGLSEWSGHAPIYYAREDGFIPQGIEIALGRTSQQRIEGLSHGVFDCLGTTLQAALPLISTGEGKIVLSTCGSTGIGTDVVVAERTKVKTTADLVNVRLAFARRTLEHLIFAMVFEQHGLDFRKLCKVDQEHPQLGRHDYLRMLVDGKVDAAVLCEPAITELFTSSAGSRFHILPVEIDQSLLQQVCVVKSEAVSTKRDLIMAYLRFVLETNTLFQENANEALSLLHRRLSNVKRSASFVRTQGMPYYLFDNIEYYDLEQNMSLYLEGGVLDKLRKVAGIAWKAGVLVEPISDDVLAASIDNSFVEEMAGE